MRKHGGTPSRRDKQVTLAAISPPGVAQGRFVGGQQSGLAGCKPPPLFTRGASTCSHRGDARGNHGAPLHGRVHLPTNLRSVPLEATLVDTTRVMKPSSLWLDSEALKEVHEVCRLQVDHSFTFEWGLDC